MKSHADGSVIWKVVVNFVDVIESSLSWYVVNGRKIRVGKDPWFKYIQQHMLHDNMVEALRHKSIVYISQLATPF